MVKDELKKQQITVTPEIEKMMIEKMIKDEIPKSSIDYIMRKAATNTIFYLPQALTQITTGEPYHGTG
jgi:predicted subunit of tRNA(5-methylaminomethyl-2-thiouridylate) methyltransferase